MIKEFHGGGIQVSNLRLGRFKGFISAKKRVLQSIVEVNANLVHTQGIRADLIGLLIQDKINVISTIHNYPFEDYKKRYGLLLGLIMAVFHIALIRNKNNVIACSKSVANKFLLNQNITMNFIQNGVDTNIYKPVDKNLKTKLRAKLKLPKFRYLFISVGQLINIKNMHTIISSFKNNTPPNSLLLIAGDGIEMEILKKESLNLPNIILLGNCDNVNEYLQASDFFISASLSEGLPNAVMEAMACGLPVILSRIDPHDELFIDQNYKYFFSPRDHNELNGLIYKMINSNYLELSQMMLKIINQNFTAQEMSQKYQKFYQQIMQ